MREPAGWLVVASLFAAILPAPGPPPAPAPPPAPWEHVVAWLRAERDRMAEQLAAAHAALGARASERGRSDLLARLAGTPPVPRRAGYAVLPEITAPAAAAGPAAPRQTRYSLDALSAAFPRDVRDAALLAARVAADPRLPLEPWVAEFERLRARLRQVEEHLGYHAWWQVAVTEHGAYFRARARLADLARRLSESPPGSSAAAGLRARLREEGLVFVPARGLRIERSPEGGAVLPVAVTTDIEDEAFIAAFRRAVESAYSESPAARALRFRLELRVVRVRPAALYPEGPPPPGASIDLDAHCRRFPAGSLVLTTGAESTYAWQGRSIVLGPNPVTARTLAHEFGHLLGFDDGYVRTYEGDPRGAFGAILVEWSGLSDDLMADEVGGQVTEAMVRRLIEAYR